MMLYYPALDYLRIILAVAVDASHSGFIGWSESGGFAVQVFFALSGWLIGGILLRSAPQDLPRFYFNRAARIWIPYIVAIVLLMAASLLKEHVTAKWLEIFFYNSTFVYNFFGPPQLAAFRNAMPLQATGNHFWSICSEEQFYLAAPFLITVLPMKIGRSVWFWIVLAAIALVSPYWDYFGSISLGVLASVLRGRLGDWHSVRSVRLVLGIIGFAVLAAMCINLISYRVGASLSAVCIVLFLARAGQHSSFASFVGGISYPLYLDAWVGGFMANFIFGKFALRDSLSCRLTGMLLSLCVATVLYIIIDRNVRQNRERFFTASRGKLVAVVGFTLVIVGFVGGMMITSKL